MEICPHFHNFHTYFNILAASSSQAVLRSQHCCTSHDCLAPKTTYMAMTGGKGRGGGGGSGWGEEEGCMGEWVHHFNKQCKGEDHLYNPALKALLYHRPYFPYTNCQSNTTKDCNNQDKGNIAIT